MKLILVPATILSVTISMVALTSWIDYEPLSFSEITEVDGKIESVKRHYKQKTLDYIDFYIDGQILRYRLFGKSISNHTSRKNLPTSSMNNMIVRVAVSIEDMRNPLKPQVDDIPTVQIVELEIEDEKYVTLSDYNHGEAEDSKWAFAVFLGFLLSAGYLIYFMIGYELRKRERKNMNSDIN